MTATRRNPRAAVARSPGAGVREGAQSPSAGPRSQPDPEAADTPAVMTTIAGLTSGRLSGRQIDPETRRDCVEHLYAEGVSIPEIASILARHERTVRRDLEQIRARNALAADPELAARVAGELVTDANLAVQRIRRAARESSASPMDRIDAERAVVEVRTRVIETLQSLGHLPREAHRWDAQVQVSPGVSLLEQAMEARRLRDLAPADGAIRERLDVIQAAVTCFEGSDAATPAPAPAPTAASPDPEAPTPPETAS